MCGWKARKKAEDGESKPRVDESIFDFPFVCADIDEREILMEVNDSEDEGGGSCKKSMMTSTLDA